MDAAHDRAAARGEGMTFDQIAIAFTGVIAIFLSQDGRESRRRFACVFGLAAQPFWFYSAWKAHQWGIFVLCFCYATSWARGFWTYWIRPWLMTVSR